MEKIQLGKYKVAEKWEDVTLLQWQNYVRNASSKEDNSVDIISTLETFSDIPRSVINQMPTDLFESVIGRLKWITEQPDQTPTQSVEISGETYTINVMEKLKVKEYLDLNTVIENDKFNYSMIFAILCRKQGEEYDEEFIADKLPDRLEMFEQMNCVEGMKLIAFFFNLLGRIRNTFPKLFSDKFYKSGRNRTCKEYKEFTKAYGLYHSIASAADYKITEIREIFKQNLMFFFEYLTYMQDKALADEFQDKYLEKLRKQKAL